MNAFKMIKKFPAEVLSPSELAYMSRLNERDKRWFLATKAEHLKKCKDLVTAKLVKLWEQVHILSKKEDKNCFPMRILVMTVTAKNEPVGRVCFLCILSGSRLSCK